MPHLSPMNWLLIILSTWAMISMIMTIMFFTNPSKFSSPLYSSKSLKSTLWSW